MLEAVASIGIIVSVHQHDGQNTAKHSEVGGLTYRETNMSISCGRWMVGLFGASFAVLISILSCSRLHILLFRA